MLSQDLKFIAIAGAGQMGSGIAQVFVQSGLRALLYDVNEAQLAAAAKRIHSGLVKLQEKGKLGEPAEEAFKRLETTSDLNRIAETDFVIEAVTENEIVKLELIRQLGQMTKPGVIMASNTSSISITRLGQASGRPELFIGVHFMNPAPLMRLVEVVVGLNTAPATVEFVQSLVTRVGKKSVLANDFPGFIVNRILLPMINEAISALGDGVGTAEHIDEAMMLGSNQPMGPLALADLIGLDTVLSIMEVMHHMFGDDKYRPAPLLRRYVDAGRLGRKSKRGFYEYPVV